MLAGVCLSLMQAGNTMTVVARDRDKLARLRDKGNGRSGKIVPVAVDYSHTDELVRALEKAIGEHGNVSAIVSWIHNHSRKLLISIIDLIGNDSDPPEFFDILGSDAANPQSAEDDVSIALKHRRDIRYYRIILGFKITSTGSRWLTDEEICDGVLKAMHTRNTVTIVGVVEPSDRKP